MNVPALRPLGMESCSAIMDRYAWVFFHTRVRVDDNDVRFGRRIRDNVGERPPGIAARFVGLAGFSPGRNRLSRLTRGTAGLMQIVAHDQRRGVPNVLWDRIRIVG